MTERDTFLLIVAMEEAGDVQALIQLLEEQGLIDCEVRQQKRKARYKKHK